MGRSTNDVDANGYAMYVVVDVGAMLVHVVALDLGHRRQRLALQLQFPALLDVQY